MILESSLAISGQSTVSCVQVQPLELTLLQTSSLRTHTCRCILPKGRVGSRCPANPFCLVLRTTRPETEGQHSCAMWHPEFMLHQDLTLPSWLRSLPACGRFPARNNPALSQTQPAVSRPPRRPAAPSTPPAWGVHLPGARLAWGSWRGTSTHSHWLSAAPVHCCP